MRTVAGLKMRPSSSAMSSPLFLWMRWAPPTRVAGVENSELFRLVHGGYGLFGIVTSVQLRLVPRKKVERVVELRTTDDLITAFEKRIADGFLYGDFQFSIERESDDFLHKGVFPAIGQCQSRRRFPPTSN